MKWVKFIVTIFFCIMLIAICNGQKKYFKTWKVGDRLHQSLIYDIAQDATGNLILASYGDGILKFDGHEFQALIAEDDSLPMKYRAIERLKDGRLLLGSEGHGLYQLDNAGIQPIRYSDNAGHASIRNIEISSLGEVILTTRLNEVIVLDSNFKEVDRNKFSKVDQVMTKDKFLVYADNQLWSVFQGKYKFVKQFDEGERLLLAVGNSAYWIQDDQGIEKRNVSGEVLYRYPFFSSIISILKDISGRIWFASEGEGILMFDGEEMKQFTTANGLGSDIVVCIFEDDYNDIWFGTEGGGFSRYEVSPIVHYGKYYGLGDEKVTAISTGVNGNHWFGTLGNGLMSIDATGKVSKELLPAKYIMSLHEFNENELIIGTIDKGVYRYDGAQFVKFQSNGLLDKGRIMQIAKGKNGEYLFATSDEGLIRYKNGVCSTVRNSSHWNQLFAITSGHENYVSGLLKGIGRYNYEHSRIDTVFTDIPLFDKRIVTLAADGSRLWVGTEGSGLYCIIGNRVTQFIKRDGLMSDNVFQVLMDPGAEGIWIGSDRGITHFKIKESVKNELRLERIDHFNVIGDDWGIETSLHAIDRDAEGAVWFGTIDGLVKYDYKQERIPKLLATVLTHAEVFDQDIKEFANWEDGIASLNHDENHISFKYVGISYDRPEEVSYRVRLDPLDKIWSRSSKLATLTYSSLPPGEYKFEVESRVGNQAWVAAPSYRFNILPPLWKTTWFRFIGSALILALITSIFKIRGYRLKKRQVFLENEIDKQTKELRTKNQQYLRAKEVAERAKEVEEQFIANVSHEMRTPMNAILGLSNLLIDGVEPDKHERYVKNIRFSARNLLTIVNDVLDMSKLEQNKLEIIHENFDLRERIQQIIDTVKLKADEKRVQVRVEWASNTQSLVRGDAVRLTQILLNLLDNAVKFTDVGSVVLSIESNSAHQFIFEITDTGIGIPVHQQNKIFDRFIQLESVKSNVGTGLGLAICKKLVDLLNGQISFESGDSGTAFKVQIPFQAQREAVVKVAADYQSLGALRVLIAEDNPLNQEVIVGYLKKWKVNDYVLVENGMLVIEKLKERAFDLILMDLNMPILDGVSATKEIRKIGGEKSNIPIIAVTAYHSTTTQEETTRAGMNGYIIKPINPEKLIRICQKYAKIASIELLTGSEPRDKRSNAVLVDLSVLNQLGGLQAEPVRKIIAIFIAEVPKALVDLSIQISIKDKEEIRKNLHNLSSNFKYMGVDKARLILDEIRAYVVAEKWNNEIEEAVNELGLITVEVVKQLQELLDN